MGGTEEVVMLVTPPARRLGLIGSVESAGVKGSLRIPDCLQTRDVAEGGSIQCDLRDAGFIVMDPLARKPEVEVKGMRKERRCME